MRLGNTFPVLLLFMHSYGIISAQTAQLSFSGSRQDYQWAGALAIADFNGDGYPDIVSSGSNNQVEILLNDKQGHYSLSAALPGSPAQYFATGDFNRDGRMDVAFSAYNAVFIALGAGDGTLRNLVQVSGGGGGDLRVADFNGDGKLDVVVGGYTLTVFFGNGDGTLKAPVSAGSIGSPFVVTDVNGDGKPDLVGTYNQSIVVALNTGTGFTAGDTIPLQNQTPIAMATGDIDNNGTADLVVSAGNPGVLITYTGNGAGDFAIVNTDTLAFQCNQIALLDANADGNLDLFYDKVASSHPPATNLVLRPGNGTVIFGANTPLATAGASTRILLSDTRRSGKKDLITSGSGETSILTNKGDNTFAQGSFFSLPGELQASVSGDFNGDGIRDLVVSVRLSAVGPGVVPLDDSQFAGAFILLGTGDGHSPFRVAQRLFVPPDVLKVATGDFNKDGRLDLAFVTGQDLVIYTGLGDGTFASQARYPCTCTSLAVADVNADGKPDIVTTGVFVFLGRGDGTFGSPTLPFFSSGNFIAATDLNGDGKADLIAGSSSGPYGFLTAFGNGDGTFITGKPYGASGLVAGVVADFNGDGVPDFAELYSYGFALYLNAGDGTFGNAASSYSYYPSSANTIAAADFNNDGKTDVVVPGIDFMVYLGVGDGTLTPPQYFGSANYPNVMIANDFYDFGTGRLPDLIGVGQNGAISTLFNQSN